MPAFLLCIHPIARDTIAALVAVAILVALAALTLRKRLSWIPFATCALLIALAGWFGSYRLSPLGFGSGRIPLLSGFWITRAQRTQARVAPREVITMAEGSAIGIQPVILPGPVSCMWSHSSGGAVDDPASCETSYEPGPGTAFDTLRVSIRSGCGLPSIVGELRISVLP